MEGVLIGTPDKLSNDDDGAPTICIVNTLITVMELVTYDDLVVIEEGAGGNVVFTNLIRRLIRMIRLAMGHVAGWTDYNSQEFWEHGRGMVVVWLGPPYEMTTLETVTSNVITSAAFSGFHS